MKQTWLLGTIKNRIITCDFETRDWNGYPELSVCFQEGEAINVDNVDEETLRDYFEEVFDDAYDAQGKVDLTNGCTRTRDDVIDEWICDATYRDRYDCSCTDYEMEINGNTYNFETIGAGQHDCREDNDFNEMKFTNEEAFNLIMHLWDNFHLHRIGEEQDPIINKIYALLEPYEEYGDEFEAFIRNNLTLEEGEE